MSSKARTERTGQKSEEIDALAGLAVHEDVVMESSGSSFSATFAKTDGTPVVVLIGELDMDSIPLMTELRDQIIDDGGTSDVVFDLSGLTFIDSSGLAVLVSLSSRLSERAAP